MGEEKKDEKVQLLERVFGGNKERDLFILQSLADGSTYEDTLNTINQEFPDQNLADITRISQIARVNKELLDELTFKSEFASKAGRIRLANRILKKKGNTSRKDTLDWSEHIRKEQEGEGGAFPQVIRIEVGIPVPKIVEDAEKKE